jgi:hypothetical protein
VPKVVSSADGLGGNQDLIGPRSETLADDEAKHSMEKGPEEVAEKQNKAQGEETDIRVEAVASSQQQPNQTIQFSKPDHLVSPGSVQRKSSETKAPETAPTSLVSSRTHVQPAEEDPADESIEIEGGSDREEKR